MEDISWLQTRCNALGEQTPPGRLRCLLRSIDAPGNGLTYLARVFAGAMCGGDCPFTLGAKTGLSKEERALDTYQRWTVWRKEYHTRVGDKEVQQQIAAMRSTGFYKWHGADRGGLPICWVRPSLFKPSKDSDAVCILYDQICEEGNVLADAASVEVGGGGPFCVVYDRDGLDFSHARHNAASCRAMLAEHWRMADTLVDMFYQRAGKAYVVNGGGLFTLCWRFAKPFLLPEVANRLIVLRKPADLLDHIEFAQMPSYMQDTLGIANVLPHLGNDIRRPE